jgi:pimeloyl-ACP methyl ester carboxylesterase
MPSVSGQRRKGVHDSSSSSSSSRRGKIQQQQSQGTIKYEVVKGPLVKFSDVMEAEQVPTAVLVHGILGSGKNLRSFARKLARENPAWQFLLVDLRCHGDSANSSSFLDSQNSVDGAAADVLQLLETLSLFPKMLIGHSFGGKVVMKMVDQFGSKALPRPVKVWVLDTVPGDVRSDPNVGDHPRSLIDKLLEIPLPIHSPNVLVEQLRNDGFSFAVAAWVATNLTLDASGRNYTWKFDLNGIKQMYDSYENADLWNVIERPPQGLSIDFVRAERSTFRWAGADHHRIESNGAQVHMLEDAGHWVHTDNPDGLLRIMKSSFG